MIVVVHVYFSETRNVVSCSLSINLIQKPMSIVIMQFLCHSNNRQLVFIAWLDLFSKAQVISRHLRKKSFIFKKSRPVHSELFN